MLVPTISRVYIVCYAVQFHVAVCVTFKAGGTLLDSLLNVSIHVDLVY